VRLRWRLQESKLTFWYEMVRPHKFIEDALREILARVAQETGIAVLAGARTK
jgi:GTP cyclohydrolase FolE2